MRFRRTFAKSDADSARAPETGLSTGAEDGAAAGLETGTEPGRPLTAQPNASGSISGPKLFASGRVT
jgi:hypothetical protein